MTTKELREFIWKIGDEIKELREAQLKTDEQMKKTDEKIDKIGKEIDKLKEAQLKTDEQLDKTSREIDKLKEVQLKTDEQMKKTDEKINRMSDRLGSIGRSQGAVAEEYFYNSLKENKTLLGMKFEDIGLNWKKSKKGVEDEFDIILINSKNIVLIEVKYKAHENDIKKLDKKVINFKKLFPEYSHLKLYTGIATFHIYEDAKELANQMGYFVLKRNGNVIEEYVADKLKVTMGVFRINGLGFRM